MEDFCICDSCIHQSACVFCFASCGRSDDNFLPITKCKNFEDKELWVKLPCKVGTEVFKIFTEWGCSTHCPYGTCSANCEGCQYLEDKSCIRKVKYEAGWSLGYNIFLNKEDAEKELARRREECAKTGKSFLDF